MKSIKVTVSVVEDWRSLASADIEVPTFSQPSDIGQLVKGIIPEVLAEAHAKSAADAAAANAKSEPVEV